MKIKKVDELNEKTNGAKAIALGYKIGDTVYNNKLKKNVIIAHPSKPISEYGEDYCSLGAIGEFPQFYSKVKVGWNSSDNVKKEKINQIFNGIDTLLLNDHYTKKDLIEFLTDYIENK